MVLLNLFKSINYFARIVQHNNNNIIRLLTLFLKLISKTIVSLEFHHDFTTYHYQKSIFISRESYS